MTEKEYIDAEALGIIMSAISTLRNLIPDNLEHIIKKGESASVFGTLHKWRDRLHQEIEITTDE